MRGYCNYLKTTNMTSDCGHPECAKGKILPRTKALQCEICEISWHIECAEVKEEQFSALKNINGAHWFCHFCSVGSAKVLKILAKVQNELADCKEELKNLKARVVEDRFISDKQEMYSRKENLRISGMADPHRNDEDTNEVVLKVAHAMGVDLKPEDISVSHRLGKNSSNWDRPVIVRFVRRDTKKLVMSRKKALKEKANFKEVYINEDLTRTRYRICKELHRLGKTVWTRDGKIVFKEDEDTFNVIDTYQDFCKLNWTEEKLTELDILQ